MVLVSLLYRLIPPDLPALREVDLASWRSLADTDTFAGILTPL